MFVQEIAVSTQENAVPSSLAHLLIELSQDSEKREEFRRDPSPFLANYSFSAKEINALLSRDLHLLRSAFGLRVDGNPGVDGLDDLVRSIVRDELKKSKKKKKPSKKKKDKGPKKKK
jgi:hypothetical protein